MIADTGLLFVIGIVLTTISANIFQPIIYKKLRVLIEASGQSRFIIVQNAPAAFRDGLLSLGITHMRLQSFRQPEFDQHFNTVSGMIIGGRIALSLCVAIAAISHTGD